MDYIQTKIEKTLELSLSFFDLLKVNEGCKYTANHDTHRYPSAVLYGTWSVVYGKHLILGEKWVDADEKLWLKNSILRFRQKDGTIYPSYLDEIKNPKSHEYLKLHTTNYAVGALMILDNKFDFQSKFFDEYLNADYLNRWLSQRSFIRPWEESNNIVNVASYLALCNDNGDSRGKERLYQMLEWHKKFQNPKTGGFENFSISQKNIIQSMAGAVHNFHIYHYLNEPIKFESIIGLNITPFLFNGALSACHSIDFTELSCHVLPYLQKKEQDDLIIGMYYHLNKLIEYQNKDGGWLEAPRPGYPTQAAGMKEDQASSCSYSTWFRLCSIAMILITLVGDNREKWHFRNTLGMGYFHINENYTNYNGYNNTNYFTKLKFKATNIPYIALERSIEILSKIIG
jgi:hypothetical protein